MIIADASVLIALAKMHRLDLLKAVYGDLLIGPQVKAETVDAGKRISAPGVELIEKALDDSWLQVAQLSSKEKSTAHGIVSKGSLDAGEAESLALASSRKLIVILDDSPLICRRDGGHVPRNCRVPVLRICEKAFNSG